MITNDNDEYSGERVESWVPSTPLLAGKLFENCEFIKCNLIGFKFIKCKFDGCKFSSCMFSAVEFENCEVVDTAFINSKVIGIDWTKLRDAARLEFKDSVLDMSNFGFLKLAKSKFVNCSIKECDFTNTDLSMGDLSGSDFENTRFANTNLTKANLAGSKKYMINVFSNKLTKAKFSMPEVIDLLKSLDIVIE